MSENVENLTEIEIANSKKVKEMILDLPDISFKNLREDLFLITEPESGVEFTADVEDDTLFVRAEVTEIPNDVDPSGLYKFLLEKNAVSVHVAFGIDQNTIVLTGTLEIENLDLNELEATFKSLIITLYSNSDEIANYLEPKEQLVEA